MALSDGSAFSYTVGLLLSKNGATFNGQAFHRMWRRLSAEEEANFYNFTVDTDPQILRAFEVVDTLTGRNDIQASLEPSQSSSASEAGGAGSSCRANRPERTLRRPSLRHKRGPELFALSLALYPAAEQRTPRAGRTARRARCVLFRQEKEEEARESDGYFHHQNAVRGARLSLYKEFGRILSSTRASAPKIAEAAGLTSASRAGGRPRRGVLTKELARRKK